MPCGKLGETGGKGAGVRDRRHVTRIGGTDRFDTANRIAEATVDELGAGYDGCAFVATGLNFPDALAASPIAAANGRPIFLAGKTSRSSATMQMMSSCGVAHAQILGSTGAVCAGIESQLDSELGPSNVDRLQGADRYATAVAIATEGCAHCGLEWDRLAIATGHNFPDALAGGVMQGCDGSVLLLTPGDRLHASVAAVLQANRDGIGEVRYLGSTNAVSQAVRDEVRAILK